MSIKALENLAEFNLLQNLHLCTQKSVCATNFGPLGEIGAYFSRSLKINVKNIKIEFRRHWPVSNGIPMHL